MEVEEEEDPKKTQQGGGGGGGRLFGGVLLILGSADGWRRKLLRIFETSRNTEGEKFYRCEIKCFFVSQGVPCFYNTSHLPS